MGAEPNAVQAGRAQAALLLNELDRHAQFLVSRIEHAGRRNRDIVGEIAELKATYQTATALAAQYDLPRTTVTTMHVGHPGQIVVRRLH